MNIFFVSFVKKCKKVRFYRIKILFRPFLGNYIRVVQHTLFHYIILDNRYIISFIFQT